MRLFVQGAGPRFADRNVSRRPPPRKYSPQDACQFGRKRVESRQWLVNRAPGACTLSTDCKDFRHIYARFRAQMAAAGRRHALAFSWIIVYSQIFKGNDGGGKNSSAHCG